MVWDLFVVVCSLKETELLRALCACLDNDLRHTRANQHKTSSKLATSQMWEKLSGVDQGSDETLNKSATEMLLNPR